MKPSELNVLLNQYGMHRQGWRAEILFEVSRLVWWAQVRAFCYGIIASAFILWVGMRP